MRYDASQHATPIRFASCAQVRARLTLDHVCRDGVGSHALVWPLDRLAQLRLGLHLLLEARSEDGRREEEVHADPVQEELVAERVGQAWLR